MELGKADSYLTVLKKIGAGKMHFRLLRWWKDTSQTARASVRITGEEAKCLCHGFMKLIDHLMTGDVKKDLQLYCQAYAALKLRDAASVFVRVHITECDIDMLETACSLLFAVYHFFMKANLTIWTICYVVPQHTRDMFEKYGLGLGILSMQGREAKHKKIMAYLHHTSTLPKTKKWVHAFRHEYADLLLTKPEKKHQRKRPESEKIIPDRFKEDDTAECLLQWALGNVAFVPVRQ